MLTYCVAISLNFVWTYELKIGLLFIVAPGNVYTNFLFSGVFFPVKSFYEADRIMDKQDAMQRF